MDSLTNRMRNIDSPFTEIFSLIVKYKDLSKGFLTLAYEADELMAISSHVDNAIIALLHGSQDLGRLMGIVQGRKKLLDECKDIGGLFSSLSNLIEALYTLRLDADYALRTSKAHASSEQA